MRHVSIASRCATWSVATILCSSALVSWLCVGYDVHACEVCTHTHASRYDRDWALSYIHRGDFWSSGWQNTQGQAYLALSRKHPTTALLIGSAYCTWLVFSLTRIAPGPKDVWNGSSLASGIRLRAHRYAVERHVVRRCQSLCDHTTGAACGPVARVSVQGPGAQPQWPTWLSKGFADLGSPLAAVIVGIRLHDACCVCMFGLAGSPTSG